MFVGQREKNWFNPTNWEMVDVNERKDNYLTQAMPYIERVPCSCDRVSFPESNAFQIEIAESLLVKEVLFPITCP